MPEYDSSRITAPDVKFSYDHTARPLYSSKARRVLVNLSNYVEKVDGNYQKTLRSLRAASAVVASGGDVFCSEYGHISLLSHLRPLDLAAEAGIPFFIHAQSIGPFKNKPDSNAFVKTARRATAITVRERMTYDYLTTGLGLSGDLVTHTADPAFLLARPDESIQARYREFFRLNEGRPTVALSTSQAICNWLNSDYTQHFQAWCEVVRMLLDEMKANIVFIPHVQEISVKNDDRILATELLRHFNHDPRLHLAGADYTASEYKGIISQCDLVVAERMHAAIAGLSSAVCTVPIGYSIKAEGILTDLFAKDLVRDTLLIPLKDFLDPKVSCGRIRQAWAMRKDIKSQLEMRLPEVRRRSALSFEVIANAIREHVLKRAA